MDQLEILVKSLSLDADDKELLPVRETATKASTSQEKMNEVFMTLYQRCHEDWRFVFILRAGIFQNIMIIHYGYSVLRHYDYPLADISPAHMMNGRKSHMMQSNEIFLTIKRYFSKICVFSLKSGLIIMLNCQL